MFFRLQPVVVMIAVAGAGLAVSADPWQPGRNAAPITGHPIGRQMDRIEPGEFIIDPPTLENLGFRWYIEGDSNRNASVAVAYRRQGETRWRDAQPMLRVHHELPNLVARPHRVANLFAGSVLFLEPGTTYEVRLTMTDPDGGAPPEPKIVTVATRNEPQAFDGGRTLHVYPPGHSEAGRAGALVGLKAGHDAAQPGDIVLLHAGVYTLDECLEMSVSGTPDRPIVFRGAGDGETIIEAADRNNDIIRVNGCDYLFFEDLTIRHGRIAIHGGKTDQHGEAGSTGLVVRRCRILDTWGGPWTYTENSKNWHIVDNTILGANGDWRNRGRASEVPSHTGVNIYGRGHVVARNRIADYWDNIAIANFGPPVDEPHKTAVAIDFYDNELYNAQDDNIEADYGCHNIRVYRNRCYNALMAISTQPLYGGPLYIIRNVSWNIRQDTLKLNNQPAGVLVYNNTFIGERLALRCNTVFNVHFRNNLLLGGEPAEDVDAHLGTYTPERSTWDYNGYRLVPGRQGIQWWTPNGRQTFATLAELTRATGHEANGMVVDFDIFVNAGRDVDDPSWDLRLKPDAPVVDKGTVLPNITDGYTGASPDLGAYESGLPIPHYGPRAD